MNLNTRCVKNAEKRVVAISENALPKTLLKILKILNLGESVCCNLKGYQCLEHGTWNIVRRFFRLQ
jgi:hypothetical protein